MNSIKPYISLCTGISLDGKISTTKRIQTKITTDNDRNFLFDQRVLSDAIMVGGRTLVLDDPGLTVKTLTRRKKRIAMGKSPEPIKIGIVSDVSKIKLDGDFLNKGKAKKIIFTTEQSPMTKINKLAKVADVYVCGKQKVNLVKAMLIAKRLGIKSILVEGGGELIFSLLKDGLVDEINLKIGDLILGGRTAPTLCDGLGFSEKTVKQVKLINLKRRKNYLMLKYKIVK